MPYITYGDHKSLVEKIDVRTNNPEKSLTTKKGEHIPCGYSMSTIRSFDSIENNHSLYCGEECMKKLFTSLRQHATNLINFEKKKNITVDKRRIKITSRYKGMFHFLEKES